MANNNIRSLSSRKGLKENLFESISELAEKNAPEKEFKDLAKRFLIDESVVLGTASFYDFLKPENRTQKIRICNGTACMVAGTQGMVHDLLSNHFSEEEIGHVSCVGRCHTNHAVLFNGHTYSVDSEKTLTSITGSKDPSFEQDNKYHIGSDGISILTSPVPVLREFYQLINTYIPDPGKMIGELKISNLRGRGGAGFPFWFKLDAVKKEENSQKYIVCNADEGDPGAYSDMYIMEHQPHKLLFGMYAAGKCVGADTGVIYIRGEYPDSIRKMQAAIEDLVKQKLLDHFSFKIIRGQGSYVCGEETALLNSIEGLRPEVRVRPPFPAQYGLYGKPTVLSNVETFANIHWILEQGGNAYAALGRSPSTGTKLVSLDSFFKRPGIYEIEMGTPMSQIFNDYGKGFKTGLKAFQIGGPLGGIVPVDKIGDLTLDFESFSKKGFLLGHASVVSIPADFPMIKYLEHLLKFTADESCGKCYPCRIGSHRGYELLLKSQTEDYKIDRQLFDELLETLELGSLCALGGGLPLPLKNALQYFDGELKNYFK